MLVEISNDGGKTWSVTHPGQTSGYIDVMPEIAALIPASHAVRVESAFERYQFIVRGRRKLKNGMVRLCTRA